MCASTSWSEKNFAARSWVRLEVFDAAGRMVASLLQEELAAGHHVVTWFGKDDSGADVQISDLFGWAEDHQARW